MLEDANHVFFNCVLANFAWTYFREILWWKRCPVSLEDFHLCWLDCWGANNCHIVLLSFAALIWTLWKIRNKLAIEGVFSKHPHEVIFKFMSCLQQWQVLIKKEQQMKLDNLVTLVESWLKHFCSRETM